MTENHWGGSAQKNKKLLKEKRKIAKALPLQQIIKYTIFLQNALCAQKNLTNCAKLHIITMKSGAAT